MVGCHNQLNGHEFEQTPGNGAGQESLMCCSPHGRRVGHDLVTDNNCSKIFPIAQLGCFSLILLLRVIVDKLPVLFGNLLVKTFT